MAKTKKHGGRTWGGGTSTVLSIMLVMFVFGLLMFIDYHSNRYIHEMQERITFKVDLVPGATDSMAAALTKEIESYEYVKKVDYISKDEAAELFSSILEDDFVGFLGENPLNPSLMVNFRSGIIPEHQQGVISQFKSQVGAHPAVAEVVYQENVVNELLDDFYRISWFLIIFIVLLLFVCVMLINITIRLAIFTEQQTIKTMRLVGAKTSFIARPYLGRGVLYGLIGGLLADAILAAAAYTFAGQLGINIADSQYWVAYAAMAAGLPVVGVVIAYGSTWIAIRRALRLAQ